MVILDSGRRKVRDRGERDHWSTKGFQQIEEEKENWEEVKLEEVQGKISLKRASSWFDRGRAK